MNGANIINYDPTQLDLFPDPVYDRSSPGEEACDHIRDKLVEVIDRMLHEAQRGNVPAARVILSVFPKLAKDMDNIDIWEKLRKADANR